MRAIDKEFLEVKNRRTFRKRRWYECQR